MFSFFFIICSHFLLKYLTSHELLILFILIFQVKLIEKNIKFALNVILLQTTSFDLWPFNYFVRLLFLYLSSTLKQMNLRRTIHQPVQSCTDEAKIDSIYTKKINIHTLCHNNKTQLKQIEIKNCIILLHPYISCHFYFPLQFAC